MIRVERRARGIVWAIFDRPQARNAMTFAMWAELRALAEQLAADETVRVVVFAGAGTAAFVSGTDISEFRAFASADTSGTADDAGGAAEAGVAYEARMDGVIAALEAIPVPTIAAVGGACTGGGVSIAAACDLRIGAPGTRVGVPIARTLGNCLSLANIARVAELIGLDRVKMLLLTGRLLDADAAHRAGFLTEIAPSDDELAAHAQATAESLTELAPLTLRATKEMARRLRAAQPLPADEDLIRACYGSDDFRTGVSAFVEKRPPNWTGR
jgi:enoyl-CoA hydratase/carnithine racemase